MKLIDYQKCIAEVWHKLYLFHPNAIQSKNDKLQVLNLQLALEKIAKSPTPEQLVIILNRLFFKNLNDPFSFAQFKPKLPKAPLPQNDSVTIEDVKYFSLKNPVDSSKSEINSSIRHLVNEPGKSIFDLRWECTPSPEHRFSDIITSVFSDIVKLPHVQRLHVGWNETQTPYVYSQKLEVPLDSGAPHLKKPTSSFAKLIVVNNTSILYLLDYLWATSYDPNSIIVFEDNRPFFIPGPRLHAFDNDIQVHFNFGYPHLRFGKVSKNQLSQDDLIRLIGTFCSKRRTQSHNFQINIPYLQTADAIPHNFSRSDREAGLIKIGTILPYFFPDPQFDPAAWKSQWAHSLPLINQATRIDSYIQILEELTSPLNDSHIHFAHPEMVRTGQLPIRLQKIEEKYIVTSCPQNKTIECGNEVLFIEGQSLQAFEEHWMKRISASTPQALFRDICHRIHRGPPNTSICLVVSNGSRTWEINLDYTQVVDEPTSDNSMASHFPFLQSFHQVFPYNIAYLKPFEIAHRADLRKTFEAIKDTVGLILDLRGYPKKHFKHTLIRCLCDYPVASPRYEIPVIVHSDIQRRTWQLTQHTIQPSGASVYTKPVIVLIDETVQSAAEDFCMHLHSAQRSIFVGRPTAGCQGNAAYIHLPIGGWMSFTGMRVMYPDGQPVQGIGLLPDIRVERTIKGICEKRDEILEAGLTYLQEMV